jgi:glycosyltransferase involved in cell wall biosynthesis
MKIAVFHNLPDGGAKRVLFEQVKNLSEKHILGLYTIKGRNSISFLNPANYIQKSFEYSLDYDMKVHGYINRIRNDYYTTYGVLKLHRKIAEDIDKHGYDVVLAHPDIITESPYILRYLKTPSLYYSHELLRMVYEEILQLDEGVDIYKRFYESAVRLIRKKTDKDNAKKAIKIITNSLYMKNNIKLAYGEDAYVCYPGVDVEFFKKSKRTANAIIFIGNKTKLDGYDLLERIKALIIDNIEIKLLGISGGKAKIKNDDMLSKKYSESLVTLCLDYSEPFGLKVIESMACETPVLAVNEGGYRETVIDGVTGFLLPRDPKLFAEKIEWLMNNPDEARRMGKAGREHVKKNFTWEKHNKCIEKLLIETANAKK